MEEQRPYQTEQRCREHDWDSSGTASSRPGVVKASRCDQGPRSTQRKAAKAGHCMWMNFSFGGHSSILVTSSSRLVVDDVRPICSASGGVGIYGARH